MCVCVIVENMFILLFLISVQSKIRFDSKRLRLSCIRVFTMVEETTEFFVSIDTIVYVGDRS